MLRIASTLLALTLANAVPALADTPSPPGAKVYFVGLKNGDIVGQTFVVHFGLSGMGIAPAGVEFPNTGHHHLVVDADTPPLNAFLPTDAPQHVMHFGKGQTEVELKLPPGRHTLQLVFADQDHKPHTPAVVSEKIAITVK
jgi:hypothetical protein